MTTTTSCLPITNSRFLTDDMKISEITSVIEAFAPLAWQEDYDNAGLIVGRPDARCMLRCWPWT